MTIAIGWDPGPTLSAYGILQLDRRGQPMRFIRSGKVSSHYNSIRLILKEASGLGATICAVESPKGFIFQHARGAALLETKGVAQDIATTARERGFQVFEAACQEVRRALCGKGILGSRGRGTAGDGVVREVLPKYVMGLPGRSNSHERDAMMVAVVALLNPGAKG